jgi:hypothetical protein
MPSKNISLADKSAQNFDRIFPERVEKRPNSENVFVNILLYFFHMEVFKNLDFSQISVLL